MNTSAIIEKRVDTIRFIYLTLIMIGIAGLIFRFVVYQGGNFVDVGAILVQILVFVFIFVGLKNKGEWVLPLVLIVSACGVLRCTVTIANPAHSVGAIILKGISVAFFVFYGYQLRLFTKQSVKKLYGQKGQILF